MQPYFLVCDIDISSYRYYLTFCIPLEHLHLKPLNILISSYLEFTLRIYFKMTLIKNAVQSLNCETQSYTMMLDSCT